VKHASVGACAVFNALVLRRQRDGRFLTAYWMTFAGKPIAYSHHTVCLIKVPVRLIWTYISLRRSNSSIFYAVILWTQRCLIEGCVATGIKLLRQAVLGCRGHPRPDSSAVQFCPSRVCESAAHICISGARSCQLWARARSAVF